MKNLLLFLFVLLSYHTFAQREIFVQVTDEDSGDILPFANVYLQKNNIGSIVDASGIAQLNLSASYFYKDSLRCSFVGYRDTSIYVDLFKKTHFDVHLKPDFIQIQEVDIRGKLSKISAIEIIKKARKKIKNNYYKKPINLDAFYRELIYQNDTCVLLQEAIVKLYYTGYPQKRYVRKSFRKYYGDSYYFRHSGGSLYFGLPQYFKYYNTTKDEAKIIVCRISDYQGEGRIPSPNGGPLAMTALDKVKYLSDILDRRLRKKYVFKKTGAVYIGDRICYTINYFPKAPELVYQPWNRKMKYAVYEGTIFVDIEDFSIVRLTARFAKNTKLGIYKNKERCRQFPDVNDLEIDYERIGKKMVVKRILTEQVLMPSRDTKGRCLVIPHRYKCTRELIVNNVKLDSVQHFDKSDPTLLKDIQYANLRDFPTGYNSEIWAEYEKGDSYKSLTNSEIDQLEKNRKLEKQFENRFYKKDLQPPNPQEDYDTVTLNNQRMVDAYRWLEDSHDVRTQDYIAQENDYFENFFRPYQSKFYKIYYAITHGTKRCNNNSISGVPSVNVSYAPTGEFGLMEYDSSDVFSKIVVDFAELNAGKSTLKYFSLSPSKNQIAMVFEYNDNQMLYIKDLTTGLYVDSLSNTYEQIFWKNNDNLCYVTLDATGRTDGLFVFNIPLKENRMLLQPINNTYEIERYNTALNSTIINIRNSCDNSFYYLPDADSLYVTQLTGYGELVGDWVREDSTYWYVLGSKNGEKKMIFRKEKNGNMDWEVILQPRDGEYFDNFFRKDGSDLVKIIKGGKTKVYAYSVDDKSRKELSLPEKHHALMFEDAHLERDSLPDFYYESPNIPGREYMFNSVNQSLSFKPYLCFDEHEKVKQKYISETLEVEAEDGQLIPLTLTRSAKKNLAVKGILLRVYGAYGAFMEAGYDEFLKTLMDNGYVIAVAHVRGSRAKGTQWYQAGKGMQKKNSISDYLACAKYLKQKKKYQTDKIVAYGQSAGGVVVGGAINESPELFVAAIFDYPYLDVINTMSNDKLYLTTTEYCEWGNPNLENELAYMHSYSPYQNIKKQEYPPMIFLSGLKDRSTPYWQVIKSVARYRENNTGISEILSFTSNGQHPGLIPYQQRMKEMMYLYFFIESILG